METSLHLNKRITIITGGFGSGKSEIAINLAIIMSDHNNDISLIDLDIVNPYFRSREAKKLCKTLPFKIISPQDIYHSSDLPIILPEVKGLIANPDKYIIIDLGGDEIGIRILKSFQEYLKVDSVDLLFVVNNKRPFTDTIEGCLKTLTLIEKESDLKVTGLVSNGHLTIETSIDVIIEGLIFTNKLSKITKIPVFAISIMKELIKECDLNLIDAPILPISRILLPPWISDKRIINNIDCFSLHNQLKIWR